MLFPYILEKWSAATYIHAFAAALNYWALYAWPSCPGASAPRPQRQKTCLLYWGGTGLRKLGGNSWVYLFPCMFCCSWHAWRDSLIFISVQANEQKQTNKLFSKDMWGSDHLKRETICIVIFLKRKISYTYISVDIPVVLLRPWKIVSSYIHTCFYCWSQLLSSVRLASARPQRRKTCLLYWGTELRNLEARAEFTVCTITEYIHSAPSN